MKKNIVKHNKRQQDIVKILKKENYNTVQELSKTLKVSSVTIRKDLTILEEQGFLYRTHGGASSKPIYAFEQNITEKENINVEQKMKIAKKALTYINNNDYIILASGTTIQFLARIIPPFQNLTILTSSLPIALEISKTQNINLIQIGGEIRKSSTSVVGSIAEYTLNQFNCNKLFLGADGIDHLFGISTSNAATAILNKIMINRANKIYLLADSSKINKQSFGKICDLKNIDTLITDEGIKKTDLQKFKKIGIETIIAK